MRLTSWSDCVYKTGNANSTIIHTQGERQLGFESKTDGRERTVNWKGGMGTEDLNINNTHTHTNTPPVPAPAAAATAPRLASAAAETDGRFRCSHTHPGPTRCL